jgi:hypothetical protein
MPYMAMVIVSWVAGVVADTLRSPKGGSWSLRSVRLLMETVGFTVPGIALVMCGYTSSVTVAVTLLTISVGVNGCCYSGFNANALDISPTFAGVLFSISNTIATIPGIVSPILTGYLLGDHPGQEQWRLVFYIAFGVYMAALTVWWMCMQADVVPELDVKTLFAGAHKVSLSLSLSSSSLFALKSNSLSLSLSGGGHSAGQVQIWWEVTPSITLVSTTEVTTVQLADCLGLISGSLRTLCNVTYIKQLWATESLKLDRESQRSINSQIYTDSRELSLELIKLICQY